MLNIPLSFPIFFPSCSPVIQLNSHEQLPLTAFALAAKSAPENLHRIDTEGSISVLDPAAQPRSASPSHSAGSSDTERSTQSIASTSSGPGSPGMPPALSVIKLDEEWHSPTSSLTNIYSSPVTVKTTAAAAGRKRWSLGMFGTSIGYDADHYD